LIGCVRLSFGQRVEQRGFTRVGIADQRHRHRLITAARATLGAVLTTQLFKSRLERLDALADQTAVGFKLRFTRTTQTDTAFLTLKVSPRTNQPGRQILQLRELHLQLAFMATGALRKNIEDKTGAIDHAAIKRLLQIALLRRCQSVIENDEFDVVRLTRETQFFGLAAADEHLRVGAGPASGEGN